MRLFLILCSLLACGHAADPSELQPLRTQLEERIGADCTVVEKTEDGRSVLSIKPRKPIRFVYALAPSPPILPHPAEQPEHDYEITISPASLSPADYYTRKANYFQTLAELCKWEETLRDVPKQGVKPSGSRAENMLRELQPANEDDREKVEEFKRRVPRFTKGEGERIHNIHIFDGRLYTVSGDSPRVVASSREDLARMRLLHHEVEDVLGKLP